MYVICTTRRNINLVHKVWPLFNNSKQIPRPLIIGVGEGGGAKKKWMKMTKLRDFWTEAKSELFCYTKIHVFSL